jgi:hypothetical protein
MAKYRGRFEEADAVDVVVATKFLVALTVLLVAAGILVPTPWLRWPAFAAALLCGVWVWIRHERGSDGRVDDVANRLTGKRTQQ